MSEVTMTEEIKEQIERLTVSSITGLMPSIIQAAGPYPAGNAQEQAVWFQTIESLCNRLTPMAVEYIHDSVGAHTSMLEWLDQFENGEDDSKRVITGQIIDAWELVDQNRGMVIVQNEYVKHPEGRFTLEEARQAAREAIDGRDMATWNMAAHGEPAGELNLRGLEKFRTDHLNEELGLRVFSQAQANNGGGMCKIYRATEQWKAKDGTVGKMKIIKYIKPMLFNQANSEIAVIEDYANSGGHAADTESDSAADSAAAPAVEVSEVTVNELRDFMKELGLGRDDWPGILDQVGVEQKASKDLSSDELRTVYAHLESTAVAA